MARHSSPYNSGMNPSIKEDIEYDKTNEISIKGIAREINFKNAIVIQDPFTIIKENKTILFSEENLMDYEIPPERAYRPEAISEDNYLTPDLWYLVLMANNFMTSLELRPKRKIKVLRVDMVNNVSRMIAKFKFDMEDLGKEATRYYNPDYTLRDVD